MAGRRLALLAAWACMLTRGASAWSSNSQKTSLAESVLSRALPQAVDATLDPHQRAAPPEPLRKSSAVNIAVQASKENRAATEGDVLPVKVQTGQAVKMSFSLPSFLVGLAAGVVATLLVVGSLTDRIPRSHLLEKDEEAAAASRACERDSPEQAAVAENKASSASSGSFLEAEMPSESLHLFGPRCSWLVAMLLVQSVSSLIMESFRGLIASHMELAFFLTMLVGLGGNAGGQSVVLTVRQLARGKKAKVADQAWIGAQLAMILAPLAGLRAWLQPTPWRSSVAIGASAAVICVVATSLGAALPMLLRFLSIDPAHAAVMVQVLMDITGIMVVCGLGYLIL